MNEQAPETAAPDKTPLWKELLKWGGATLVVTLATRGFIDQSNHGAETSGLVETLTIIGETAALAFGAASGITYLADGMSREQERQG